MDDILKWVKKISRLFSFGFTRINIRDINNSTVSVNVTKKLGIFFRAKLKINEKWFEDQLIRTYDNEIKSKYIPDLHQSNDFERLHLNDILEFNRWKGIQDNQIRICLDYLKEFENSYSEFYQFLAAEAISVIDPESSFISELDLLHRNIQVIREELNVLKVIFNKERYQLLLELPRLALVSRVGSSPINYRKNNWSLFLNKEPSEFYAIAIVYRRFNEVYHNLGELNSMLDNFKSNGNHKIIVGNAGTGKTHTSAHIIKTVRENEDYIIFFKPKLFNGDNVLLDERLIHLLQIPRGYTLEDVLTKLNQFAIKQNRRCFILIDALNETTKSSIGFSNIWRTYLQGLINQIGLFTHLYFICTLRTTYIEQIWSARPSNIVEIEGFLRNYDVEEACKKYFNYYKIKPLNWEAADLSYFEVPLLLDLFCKLTNSKRESEVEITLNIHAYLQIFEGYINELVSEVKNKLNLLKDKPIVRGFSDSAERFWANNEAIVTVEDFNDAFDKDDLVNNDNSIARSVLEGYLVFIKDYVENKIEVVKHTQQEVGGYLLAKKLSEDFVSIKDLIVDNKFNEKIIGNDRTTHHQLRLDILKFLIAIRPEIIEYVKDKDGLKLSWWYLYNGHNYNAPSGIPSQLLEEEGSKFIVTDILNISSKFWFIPNNIINFEFISQVLNKLDLWEFEKNWTYTIYKNVDSFYEFVEKNIEEIRKNSESDTSRITLVAKFISFISSTTIRELRDLTTLYLVEFGQRYPIQLLEITEYASTLKDSYIYERLVSCCYGVALLLQNNKHYVNDYLSLIARRLYDLQFADNPKASVYSYIVVDSIKHLLDLAVVKNANDFSEDEINRFSNYEFLPPYDWTLPTIEQTKLIDESSHMSWPEPIGMDFGIYTIPRLMIENHTRDREAITNVYKRVFELGYKDLEIEQLTDERFKDFYWGHRILGYEGKVDRVGKKYSWKGFFDYAGYLLLNKQLNVFEKYNSTKIHYQRLGDVDIDISMPALEYKLVRKLYFEDLMAKKGYVQAWYQENKIDTIIPLLENQIENNECIMLFGKVDQQFDSGYNVRSFLLAETFFIKKDERIDELKLSIGEKVFDWDLDVHCSTDHLRHVYFGELYWADNMFESEEAESVSIPNGRQMTFKRDLKKQDILVHGYVRADIGKEVEVTSHEKYTFDSETTLSEYLWESDSNVLKGFSEYFPSIKMGKYLGLKAEPSKTKILDSNLKECFYCIEFEDDKFFRNSFNYMRSDLLREYMSAHNLVLVYQIKQHSYDENFDHFRAMKFHFLD